MLLFYCYLDMDPLLMSGKQVGKKKTKLQVIEFNSSLYFSGDSAVKNLPAKAGETGWILELGRCPGGGHGNPLQYPCRENPINRGAWQSTKELDTTK